MNRTRRRRLCVLALLCVVVAADVAAAGQDFVEREFRIPMTAAGAKGLEALMLAPNEPGPHPLVLLNHGAPRDARDRAGMSPFGMWSQAMEFARRGWVAVAFMRRGYGESGGPVSEAYGACSNPNYAHAGEESAADLRAALDYLSRQPEVDSSRILSVGISAGGFATVVLTADPPRGLVAAINFAGGRGSPSSDNVCSPDVLIKTFGDFGKRSRIPTLWIYAQNDHFFGPQLARRFFEAFTDAGGKGTFIAAPAFGDDGHALFSRAGIPVWAPMVDEFLKQQGLELRANPLPSPQPPDLAPPTHLSPKGRDAFAAYLLAPPHKAFAVSGRGAVGWASGRRSQQDATDRALEACRRYAAVGDACAAFLVDHSPAGR